MRAKTQVFARAGFRSPLYFEDHEGLAAEGEILRRAKMLCSEDGYVWGQEEAPGEPGDGDVMPPIDDSTRTEYLNRAKEGLMPETRG